MEKIILQTDGIKKHFGSFRAVDGVDLCVRQGEVFGFLGTKVAGKTTTIGMVLGLIHPTAGSVTLFGEPVTPAHTSALLRTEHTLERVGLSEAAHRKAGCFSTGMKQRLGLALALLHGPELLVLDEPTNGMDPSGMREVRQLLLELAEAGTTIFLSSHLLHEVEQVCDRVAVLNKGKVVAQGTVAGLLGEENRIRSGWIPKPRRLLCCLPSQGSSALSRMAFTLLSTVCPARWWSSWSEL